MRFVTLEQAKTYCRIVTDAADNELDLFIQAASGAVASHLHSATQDFLDSDGFPVEEDSDGVTIGVPAVVQAATLYMTAWLNRNRDEDPEKAFADGVLPGPVKALLGPLRDPVMA